MENDGKQYIAIDLKSFYASVECVQRGLDPLDTYLVVADKAHTEKTICLAVTPALKVYGISGRARLFEVIEAVDEINRIRQRRLLELYDDVDSTGRRAAVSKKFMTLVRVFATKASTTNIYLSTSLSKPTLLTKTTKMV